jgi:hypothetical protein
MIDLVLVGFFSKKRDINFWREIMDRKRVLKMSMTVVGMMACVEVLMDKGV